MSLAHLDRLAAAVRTVAGGLLVLVALAMVATIAGRYLGFATAWADEAARIAFVWSACLGAASGLHHGLHFSVSLVPVRDRGGARRAVEAVVATCIIGLGAILLWATTGSIPVAMNARLPALGISGAWFHAAVTSFAVLAVIFVSGRLACSRRVS